MREVELDSFVEFLTIARQSTLEKAPILYRGQADESYKVGSSFDRVAEPLGLSFDDRVSLYKKLISNFQTRAITLGFLDESFFQFERDHDMEAYCQHHGLPTRLIDWSYSPYIALFFAYGGVRAGEIAADKVAVYAMNETEHLKSVVADRRGSTRSELAGMNFGCDGDKELEPYRGNMESTYSFKAESSRSVNPRIHAQKGCFYVNPLRHHNFELYSQSVNSFPWLTKYTLPAGERQIVISELDSMGINLGQMYQHIDGVAIDVVNDILFAT